MSWRDTLAESLGHPRPGSGKPKTWGQTPIDNIDSIDTTATENNSVNIVNSVNSIPGSAFCDDSSGGGIPILGPTEAQEVQGWPPETQRVFVAVLDHFEGRGFVLSEAEALAYATMQKLMRRKGGLVRFAGNKVPGDLMGVVSAAKDVFGREVQAEWVPASAPTTRCREEVRGNTVCCRGCQHFQPGTGDVQHALGRCLGRPWDGHEGQWPRAPHHCANYTTSGGL